MIYSMLICVCICAQNDTIDTSDPTIRNDYRMHIAINGLIGLGFGAGAWLYHRKGDCAYADYCASNTTADAAENWDRVRRYDVLRNLCFATSIVFLARTVYYSVKQGSVPRTSSVGPMMINIAAGDELKLSLGLAVQW
jgi:hypothetical protein